MYESLCGTWNLDLALSPNAVTIFNTWTHFFLKLDSTWTWLLKLHRWCGTDLITSSTVNNITHLCYYSLLLFNKVPRDPSINKRSSQWFYRDTLYTVYLQCPKKLVVLVLKETVLAMLEKRVEMPSCPDWSDVFGPHHLFLSCLRSLGWQRDWRFFLLSRSAVTKSHTRRTSPNITKKHLNNVWLQL